MLRDLIFLLDSSFLGFRPLHDERWAAVSSLSMSVPISTINDVAERSFIFGNGLQPFQLFGKLLSANLELFPRHFSPCFSARSVSSRSCAIMSVSAGLTTPLSEARMMSLPWWLTMRPCMSFTSSSRSVISSKYLSPWPCSFCRQYWTHNCSAVCCNAAARRQFWKDSLRFPC